MAASTTPTPSCPVHAFYTRAAAVGGKYLSIQGQKAQRTASLRRMASVHTNTARHALFRRTGMLRLVTQGTVAMQREASLAFSTDLCNAGPSLSPSLTATDRSAEYVAFGAAHCNHGDETSESRREALLFLKFRLLTDCLRTMSPWVHFRLSI